MIQTHDPSATPRSPASFTDAGLADFTSELRQAMAALAPAGAGSAVGGGGDADLWFEQNALRLFRLQYAAVGPYRRVCDRRGIGPEGVRDWRGIPALATTAFKEFEITSLAAADRTAVFHSSGTTGQRPSRHYHSAASLALYEASLGPWFRQHLMSGAGDEDARLRFVVLTPRPEEAPQSSLAHMYGTVTRGRSGGGGTEWVGRVGPDGGWQVDGAAAAEVLTAWQAANCPVCVLGTAFGFVQLLDALGALGCRLALPPGSRALETGGYKGRTRALPKAELYRWMLADLGLPATHIVREYGMSELSSQAYDTRVPRTGAPGRGAGGPGPGVLQADPPRRFRFPPWTRAMVVSPEDGREVDQGQTGLLRVVDLANVWSVLAVQTEDLAVRRGSGFELIGRAAGSEARGCSLRATEGGAGVGGEEADL